MQLEIKSPELQALLAKRLESGAFQSIEEILLQALNAPSSIGQLGGSSNRRQSGRKSLAALFADSPFNGLNLSFEREDDTGRDIRL
jgi:hypothetical protein